MMADLDTCRTNAIKQQIRPWGGLNIRANEALKKVPRELFVPSDFRDLTFADMGIPLNDTAQMLSPKLEGRILDAVNISPNNTVLEIGTGSGYLTAVMATLGQSVTSVEINADLSAKALDKIKQLSIDNVFLIVADALKNPIDGFFDVIVLGASVPELPSFYLQKLNIGGRLFVVEGADHCMCAKLITRVSDEDWQTQSLFETYLPTMEGLQPKAHFEF